MLVNYQSAEVFLYEPSLQNSLFPKGAFGDGNAQRLDMLYSSLLSTQKLLDGCLARPASEHFGASVIDLGHLGRGLSSLLKLSLIEEAGWDLTHVRQRANLSYYFTEFSSRMEQIGLEIDRIQRAPFIRSFPTGCARVMRVVQSWYESKIAETSQTALPEQATVTGIMDGILNSDQFDYLNDAYWLELMGDGSFIS